MSQGFNAPPKKQQLVMFTAQYSSLVMLADG